jgi:hypothetical protein
MVADFRFDARLARAALNHLVGVLLHHAARDAGGAARDAPERALASSANPDAARYSSM